MLADTTQVSYFPRRERTAENVLHGSLYIYESSPFGNSISMQQTKSMKIVAVSLIRKLEWDGNILLRPAAPDHWGLGETWVQSGSGSNGKPEVLSPCVMLKSRPAY